MPLGVNCNTVPQFKNIKRDRVRNILNPMSGPFPIPNSSSVHPFSELKWRLHTFTDPVPEIKIVLITFNKTECHQQNLSKVGTYLFCTLCLLKINNSSQYNVDFQVGTNIYKIGSSNILYIFLPIPFCVDIFPDNVMVFLKVTGASIDCCIVIPDTSIVGIIWESSLLK